MKHSTKLLVIIATAVSTIAFAGVGWAFWSTTGTGSASGKAAALAAPTGVSVPGTSSSPVPVHWIASSPAPLTPTGYYVQRYVGTTPSDACGTSMSPTRVLVSATSCNDTAAAGTYTYRVTAVFQSWTAQSVLAGGPVTVSGDTTAPTLSTLEMFDTTGNGKVDQVKATFSEALASYTAGTTPWTLTAIPSGGTLSSVSVTGSVATLTLTEGAGGADTTVGSFKVALATNANGIRDASGNQSFFTATAPADKAAPALTLLQTLDTNSNGKVDQVKAAFSETLATYTAGNTPWTLAGVPSGGTLSSVATSGVVATLTLTEGGSAADTSVGSFTVALAMSATGIRDAAGNQSSFLATAPVDLAKPRFVSVATSGGTTAGKPEVGDVLDLTFTEPLVPTWNPSTTVTVVLTGGNGSNDDTLTIPSLTGAAFFLGAGDSYISGNGSTATFAGSTLTLVNGGKTVRLTLGSCTGACASLTAASGNDSGSVAFSSQLTDANANTVGNTFLWSAFKFF